MAYDSNNHFNIFDQPWGSGSAGGNVQNTQTNTHRGLRNDIKPAVNNFAPTSSDANGLAVASTNVFIYANGCIVGMIQSFQVTEQRTVNKLQAIGWEGVVQAVPANTNGGTLNVNRIALYESSLWNALGLTTNGRPYNQLGRKYLASSGDTAAGAGMYGSAKDAWDTDTYDPTDGNSSGGNESKALNTRLVFKTLRDQRVPLEIQVKTRREGDAESFYVETYIDCWLQSYSKAYTVQTITVAETAAISYADVY